MFAHAENNFMYVNCSVQDYMYKMYDSVRTKCLRMLNEYCPRRIMSWLGSERAGEDESVRLRYIRTRREPVGVNKGQKNPAKGEWSALSVIESRYHMMV